MGYRIFREIALDDDGIGMDGDEAFDERGADAGESRGPCAPSANALGASLGGPIVGGDRDRPVRVVGIEESELAASLQARLRRPLSRIFTGTGFRSQMIPNHDSTTRP